MSVATRVGIAALLVALVSLVITAIVGLQQGSDLADELIRDRLVTLGSSQGAQAESYIRALRRRTSSLASSPSTARALLSFEQAYEGLLAQEPSEDARTQVTEYYRDVVAPDLEEARGVTVSPSSVNPPNPAAVQIQAAYTASGAEDPTDIRDGGDGSEWSALHAELHPGIRSVANAAGFDDVYLIDAESGAIVYSLTKGVDVGTSLDVGPLSGSTLAELLDTVRRDPVGGEAVIVDFAAYAGAGDRPSAFVGSPILVGGELIGVLAARVGPADLNEIMTDDANWEGEGRTRETYLVAGDDTMRSDSRLFIEDPERYLDLADEQGLLTAEARRGMELFDTTTVFQTTSGEIMSAAAEDDRGLLETINPIGADVLSAYGTLDINGLDWAVVSEIETSELEEPIEDYARILLIVMAVFVVVLTLLSGRWSRRLAEPLRALADRLRSIQSGSGVLDESVTALPPDSPSEFVDLSEDVDSMLHRVADRRSQLEARSDERIALLHRFLPESVVKRIESGDMDILEQVPNASVAVVVVQGLGEIVTSGSKEGTRNLLDRVVDDIDALAEQHGLDRLKLSGDAYYAVCGTTRPYLDHAPRAVAFALAAAELADDISDVEDVALTTSAGVDSGAVTLGLTGGARLVYDAWGATVTSAAHLSRIAHAGQVVVSDAARSQLPSEFVATALDGTDHLGGVSSVRVAAGSDRAMP